jgi:hypothetical protein
LKKVYSATLLILAHFLWQPSPASTPFFIFPNPSLFLAQITLEQPTSFSFVFTETGPVFWPISTQTSPPEKVVSYLGSPNLPPSIALLLARMGEMNRHLMAFVSPHHSTLIASPALP